MCLVAALLCIDQNNEFCHALMKLMFCTQKNLRVKFEGDGSQTNRYLIDYLLLSSE